MRIVSVIGVPGAGKSTLVRQMMSKLSPWNGFTFGALKGHVLDTPARRVFVWGLYVVGRRGAPQHFEGTDALSMSVMIQARHFVRKMSQNERDTTKEVVVVFEGDRLASTKFFDQLRQMPNVSLDVLALTCADDIVTARLAKRTDWTPDRAWLSGRKSKVRHLVEQPSERTLVVPSETPEDLGKLALALTAYVSNDCPKGLHFRHFWHSRWQENDLQLTR